MSPLRRGMYAVLALLSAITVFRVIRSGDGGDALVTAGESTTSTAPSGATATTRPTTTTIPPVILSFERRVLGKLPGELTRAAAVPGPDGSLLVLGGLDFRRQPTRLVTQIDTKWGGTKTAGLLAQATANHSAVSVNGKIMVIGGGIDGGPGLSSTQSFEGNAGKPLGDLGRGRYGAGVAVSGGQVIIVGGGDNRGDVLDVVATTDGVTFTSIATLPSGVRYPAVGAVGNKVYVVGGEVAGRPLASAFSIDITTGAIERVAEELSTPTSHASAFVVSNSMFIAGGRTPQGMTDRIWRLEPSVGSFVFVGTLPSARSDAAVAVVNDQVYLAGGETGGLTQEVVQLTPSTEDKALVNQLAASGALDRSVSGPAATGAASGATPTITIRTTTTTAPPTTKPTSTTSKNPATTKATATTRAPTTTKPPATTTTTRPPATTANPPPTTAKPPA